MVGGPERPIAAFARPDSEVDAEVMRANVPCLTSLKLADSVRIQPRAGDMAQALKAETGSFGITSATFVAQSGGAIAALALDGVEPSEDNVVGGRYALKRQVFLVAKPAGGNARVDALLRFIASPAGDAVVRANGAFPPKR